MQWDNDLAFGLTAYQAIPHSTTGFSPNMMVYGRENLMPCDIMYSRQELYITDSTVVFVNMLTN